MPRLATKSDNGIQSLIHDTLTTAFGLDDAITNRLIKLIHDQGQWANVKRHIRTVLPSEAWQRLNQGLDLAERNGEEEPELDERDPEMEPEEPVGDEDTVGDVEDADTAGMDDERMDDEEPRREGELTPTFLGFLAELSSQQAARVMVRDKGVRRDAALQTDIQRREEIQGELEDYENSEDPQERTLAAQIKRTAMLRKRVEQQKAAKEAQQSRQPQGTF